MVGRALLRLFLVPLGCLVSAACAIIVIATLGLEKVTHVMHGREANVEAVEGWMEIISQGARLVSSATVLPAIAVVVIGEVGGIRSWLYYMIGGGAALAAVPLLARFGNGQDIGGLPPEAVWQVFATAGFLSGLIYWVIAGRGA